MVRETLLDFFDDLSRLGDPFLVHDDGFLIRTFTYRDVAGKARAFAARLRQAGIEQNDKVMFYGENRPEWVIGMWGCLLAGVIAVPVDFRSSHAFLLRVAGIVDTKAILTGDEIEPVHDAGNIPLWPLSTLDSTPLEDFPRAAITRDQVAEIVFTSGATAEPKGVIITHRNILANIVPVEKEVLKYRKYGGPFFPIRFINLLPLSHMFGQAMATFIPPMLPGVVVFLRGYNPVEIIRQIRTRRVSVLISVPQILEVLREHMLQRFPELAQPEPPGNIHWMARWWRYRRIHNLFGWKFWSFIVGAAPLPPDLEAFWSRLGFLVIQGYGLTETAPIVTLNHPFHARKGTVGKPIAGVEIKIAADGEILVRGENVTTGYFNAPTETASAFEDGWFHTGDVGALDESGRLSIQGRKKETIVTPEGLNVFPEDVEHALSQVAGVRESAVIGTDRVHAVLILNAGATVEEVVRAANAQLADHQKIRSASLWPYDRFPRTEGTGKLKRGEIAKGSPPPKQESRFDPNTPLDALTSLERVELMVALDVDEAAMTTAATIGELPRGSAHTPAAWNFPSWNRALLPRMLRAAALPGFLLPLTRIFAHIRVEGLEHLRNIACPVIFAPNHQSHLDVPAILAALPAKWRRRVAPAMAKEFFDAHFHPQRHPLAKRLTNNLSYYLSTLCFNAFPIPKREAGTLETLRYIGELASDGWCILIFPEGKMTVTGEIAPFQPGVGMIAARMKVPVVPVRIVGLDQVLHKDWRMAKPGKVRVIFGEPLHLTGENHAALAREVEAAVKALS